jgi:hypothetical protein
LGLGGRNQPAFAPWLWAFSRSGARSPTIVSGFGVNLRQISAPLLAAWADTPKNVEMCTQTCT